MKAIVVIRGTCWERLPFKMVVRESGLASWRLRANGTLERSADLVHWIKWESASAREAIADLWPPPTKAQLWRRVARLAGELAFSSQYAIPFTWHKCLNAADSIRSLIKHVRGFDEMDSMDKRHHERAIRNLEAALAAWEAAK